MKMILKPLAWSASMAAIFILNPILPVQAEEVDLSCMKHRVRAKIAVSNRFREFDVIVENQCPGPVYWSMCIERMDPQTSKILETLTPSGQVQVDKKTRVNLRMMRVSEESDPQLEFEDFYLDVGYALNPSLNSQCVASACEAKKGDLRKAFRANDKAIHKINAALTDRISTECPQSGWSGNDQAECEAEIRQAVQAELDEITNSQNELETQLAAVDPEVCQVY
jgi:hypothetical protein